MKIILANYRYYVSGGPEVYMFNIKRLLEEAGHEVIPYSVRCDLNEKTEYSSYFPCGKSESGDAYFSNVKKTPKNIVRLLSGAFYNKEAYRNLRKLIRDTKPDVVYVLQQINALSPSVFRAAHDEGIRVVHRLSDFNMMCPRSDFLCDGEICTACLGGDFSKASKKRCCHGSKITTEIRIASMKSHRRNKLFDCVDAFVCTTAFTAKLLESSGVPEDKINVIPTFTTFEEKKVSRSGDYVLYLGRISPEKGVDLLIRAVAMAPNLRLKITGRIQDDYAQSLIEMAKLIGVSDRVEFVGFVQDEKKEILIDNSYCVVCPSVWYENLPNTVLEAYAHAKPVVAFEVGCMPELVISETTGLIVPLGDCEALAQALIALAEDSDKACMLGYNGQKLCETKYAKETHLLKLVEVFEG